MKRKYIVLLMLLTLTGSFALQSCEKESDSSIKGFHIFTMPVAVTPANGAFMDITGTTLPLTWTSANEENSPILADVYFGTSEEPPLFKANHNALTLNVPVEKGVQYYWRVVMKDQNGLPTDGPLWSFVNWEPIYDFLGDYTCDEPAEDYSYDVSFYKSTPTVLMTDNYWNSGWEGLFTMNFTAKTYSMPLTVWGTYSAQEAGTIDPETGTMVGNYTIWNNGVSIETGVHTYTKH